MPPRPPRPLLAAIACAALAATAAGADEAAPDPTDALGDRLAALEQAVAADEATLARLISDPATASRLHESPEVAVIAERLPRLQAELRALRAELQPAEPPLPTPVAPEPAEPPDAD